MLRSKKSKSSLSTNTSLASISSKPLPKLPTTTGPPQSSASSTNRALTGILPSTLTDGLPLPKLFVFDLDYTLWPFWVDTHVSPPLKSVESGSKVKDSLGERFAFYEDVPNLLVGLRQKGIKIAGASRTSAPELAREMLKLLRLPNKPTLNPGSTNILTSTKASEAFDVLEAYPGSKIGHFERICEATGIGYEEMLFFDDETRNKEVELLGVTMWLVTDGVCNDEVDKAVLRWRGKQVF